MIRARKHRVFNAWFSQHAEARIGRTFAAVHVAGLETARAAVAAGPVIVASNHTSWWDPLVALYLSDRVLGAEGYALMDAVNLRRLSFFSLVGAFGVDLDRASDGAAAIRYAAGLLDRPGRLVWIFPQGRERPITERPLGFRPGSAEIARVARPATTLPIALRYEFRSAERPELFISVGNPLPTDRDVVRGRAAQEAAVTREMDAVDLALRTGACEAFIAVQRAKPSAVGAFAERLLALLTRPRGE